MTDAIEIDLDETAADTIRVPRNIMGLLRRSYDTREKVLDWMLAIFVATALAWMFRDQFVSLFWVTDPTPNAGRDDPPIPSQNVNEALDPGNEIPARVYTYNLPKSRTTKYFPGPSSNTIPTDPSQPARFPALEGDA